MSGWNRLFSYFPLMLTAATFAALAIFAAWPSGWTVALLLFVLYFLAPLTLRIMFRWAPLKEGVVVINDKAFCSWLAAHHIQAFYDALPQLEALLRVIPGFYSLWLRMWGSRVGYGVEWPVRMDVLDRNLMEIGNRVVFSHEVELAAHVRQKLDASQSRVLVRHVRVGNYAFVGPGSRICPGGVVPANASVPAQTSIKVNETFGETVRHPDKAEAEFALT